MKSLFFVLALSVSNWILADTIAPTYNRVHLNAMVTTEVENDVKVAELYAKYQGKSSIKVSDQVNQAVKWAVKIAKAHKVEVRTLNYNTNPLYEKTAKGYNHNKIIGWTATQSIRLKSRDSKLLGDVVSLIQQKLKIRSLSYEVSKERQEQVKEELMQKAIARFVKRSQKIVDGFGMVSYRLVNISINTGGYTPPIPVRYGRAKMAMAADAMIESAAIEAGSSEINVSVSGEIELN